MPVTIENSNSQRSNLSALAKNVLRKEFAERKEAQTGKKMDTIVPMDERYYDALASIVMWHSIKDANLRQVKFYLSNGYNTQTRIQTKSGVHTLVGYALQVGAKEYDLKFSSRMSQVVESLEEKVTFAGPSAPRFKVVDYEKGKYLNIHTNYMFGNYSCMIHLEHDNFLVREALGGEGAEALGS